MIVEPSTDAEIARCFPVISQLRPHLDEAGFVERVRRQMDGGYRLAALLDDAGVAAVAGYRISENLASGRHLYVDDLVTDEARRSLGQGAELLGWLEERARGAGCVTFELDSGVHRSGAHRFYFEQRMTISSFHFRKQL